MKKYTGFITISILFLAILITGCNITNFSVLTTTVSSPATGLTIIPIDNLNNAQTAAQQTAEDFIKNSSTFKFDGIEGSIKLLKTDPGFTSAFMSWSYYFEFQTTHPGHGDRTGQFLAQVIITHNALVLVDLEKDTVFWATCDNTWDMINEKDLPVTVTGIVVSGGDTTQPGGPLDAPRVFIYKILRDEGFFQNVSYTAYPHSPAGDVARAKITLDFYNGSIQVGDKLEARGTLNKETNTIVVAEQGDYIKTSLHKATVVGVVVGIASIDASGKYLYELLREDGTYVNVSYIANKDVAISLYSETVQIGDYMKAIGTYDKETNTVMVTGQDDFIKTYSVRP